MLAQQSTQRSVLLLLPLLLAGCSATTKVAHRPPDRLPVPDLQDVPPAVDGGPTISSADRLTATARSLLARPYRYSGSDPRGFDCSGFTQFVFASAGLALPRTAAQQADTGSWAPPDELRRGDLVFFGRQRDKPFHVGLVVSDPGTPLTMIHASTSRGVIATDVTASPYWRERILFGRRVLPDG